MSSNTSQQAKAKLHKRPIFIVISILVCTLFSILIGVIPFIQDIENRTLDYRFRAFPHDEKTGQDVVLIAIDDSSLRELSAFYSWPWPRDFYAHTLNYLNECEAKGVLFDILFYEPDIDRYDVTADETDGQFAKSIANFPRTNLAVQLLPYETERLEGLERFQIAVRNASELNLTPYRGARAPLEKFLNSTQIIGSVNIQPDRDGIIRRVPLLYRYQGLIIPQLSFASYIRDRDGSGVKPVEVTKKGLLVDGNLIPTNRAAEFKINWYGGKGERDIFKTYPFRALFQSASAALQNGEPLLPKEYFQDKYVVIGVTAPGLLDLKSTPISQTQPGMEIWATVLNNLINADYVRETPFSILLLYLLLIILVIHIAVLRNARVLGNLLLVLLLLMIIASPLLLWKCFRLEFPLLLPLISAVITYLYLATLSYVTEGRDKRMMKKVFSRYLHPEVINKLMENPQLTDLKGDEYNATVLFTDIYGFTTYSETTEPKKLIEHLNAYFDTLTNDILSNQGMLDKYMGDGLLAVFGVPIAREDHAYLACKSAVTHKKQWERFKEEGAEISPVTDFHLKTRIGIHTGNLVAGNIGSQKKVDYTVIGDTVNLASRLESLNKQYKTAIIISQETYNEIRFYFRMYG